MKAEPLGTSDREPLVRVQRPDRSPRAGRPHGPAAVPGAKEPRLRLPVLGIPVLSARPGARLQASRAQMSPGQPRQAWLCPRSRVPAPRPAAFWKWTKTNEFGTGQLELPSAGSKWCVVEHGQGKRDGARESRSSASRPGHVFCPRRRTGAVRRACWLGLSPHFKAP